MKAEYDLLCSIARTSKQHHLGHFAKHEQQCFDSKTAHSESTFLDIDHFTSLSSFVPRSLHLHLLALLHNLQFITV